uniref:Uncharacterized protein n=1 Tax=Picea glauca TaxID=3330 RepID=A0A117NG01_PICGL|nr:hypothetical protein ABT39_MTgene2085 [Picea glauca]
MSSDEASRSVRPKGDLLVFREGCRINTAQDEGEGRSRYPFNPHSVRFMVNPQSRIQFIPQQPASAKRGVPTEPSHIPIIKTYPSFPI